MNPTELPIRDIHLPEPIGWWPPALGWWLLLILTPLLIWLIIWLYQRITRKTALKTAKKILADIKRDKTGDDFAKLCRLSELLRRVAISQAPRSEVAGLTGRAWLEYLDQSMRGHPFTQGIGQQLINAPYQNNKALTFDVSELIDLCERWLKTQAKRKQ